MGLLGGKICLLATVVAGVVLAHGALATADVTRGGPPPEVLSGAALFHASSGDGRRVVFGSRRPLARGDRDRGLDVYVRTAGRTRLLSPGPAAGGAGEPVEFVAATADARTVLFRTEGRLTADDRDSAEDLYRSGPAGLELVSGGSSPATPAAGVSFGLLSADGRRVFFVTAESLLGEDGDERRDVYEYRDRSLRLVSTGTADDVRLHAIAADGSRVVVSTNAALDANDVDGFSDVYTYADGRATLVSAGGPVSCPPFRSERSACYVEFAAASADASRVFFETPDRLLPLDADSSTDVYAGGEQGVRLISTGPGDSQSFPARLAAVSADGGRALFVSGESFGGLAGDTHCALFERRGGRTALVSAYHGRPLAVETCEVDGIALSRDGSAVVFSSGHHRDSSADLYRRQRGRTTLASAPPPPSSARLGAFLKHVSADGSRVAFLTSRPLVPGDTDGGYDLYSRGPGGFSLISIGPAGGNAPHFGPPGSLDGAVFPQFGGASANGRRVFFATDERLLRRDRHPGADLYERGPAGLGLITAR